MRAHRTGLLDPRGNGFGNGVRARTRRPRHRRERHRAGPDPQRGHHGRHLPAASRAALLAQQALKKEGQPGDLVAALRFFWSDEAGWVSGQVTLVDGFKTLRI
jgi:NAD(P)-dependent dehydrogenase (short-subunit alcohol dehydrogenase family)